ncbi:hypothetical protein [Novosphingobium sp.]|uniref:hypothetical protein n=1 Tax=Novosphingobium sp. TaxID=1874826 RepID=UPI003BAD2901
MTAMRIGLPKVRAVLTTVTGLAVGISGAGCSLPQVHAETVYVSPTGSDTNDGSKPQSGQGGAGPVRTVARAQALAEAEQANPAARPVAIELAGGTYRLDRPLVLRSADSGTPDAPLRIYGAPGARVAVSGGVPIGGWHPGRGGELAATINLAAFGGTCPSQLFVNGVRRYRPRFPKSGTLTVAKGDITDQRGPGEPLQLAAASGALPGDFKVSPETEVVVIDAWTAARLRVAGYSNTTGRLTVTGDYRGRKGRQTFEPGLPYYIENQPVAQLDPGEWQCSSATSEVRYRPAPGESAGTLAVVAPVLTNLLILQGTPAEPVHDVAIENIEFEHAAWEFPVNGWSAMQSEIGLPAAVRAENCRSIVFHSIGIARSGAQGIAIGKNCADVELADSQLTDLGGGGVLIGSPQRKPQPGSDWEGGATSRTPTTDIRILRNTLRSLGRIHLAGTGIWVGQADHVAIVGNRISDLYYTGISVGWVWSDELSPIHDNLIADNRIENFGQGVLSDMGGIYTLGRQFGTVVRGNQIANGTARTYGGWGLYADQGSTGIAFINNAVGKTSAEPMFVHQAGNLRIVGNHRIGDTSDALVCPATPPASTGGAPGVTYSCNFRSSASQIKPPK